ncbi:uncharacterized protein WCC33_013463 [Rhinophrynus dorsalis]
MVCGRYTRDCLQDLRRLLDMGYFTPALHLSYMESGLYNVKVVTKCLDLLERNSFSFADIQKAKVAFSAYEHLDEKGLRAESGTLLKAIKMCGFAISPQKLSGYLKQKRHSYGEEGRIQLYEFLDLLTLCEPRSNFIMNDKRVGSTDKTSRGVYQLDDMRSFMVTPDEKLARHLDQRFQKVDSWQLPQSTMETLKPKAPSKCQQTAILNGTRPQPPWRESELSLVDLSEETWTLLTPVPHVRCHCYPLKKMNPILSDKDLQDTQNGIEDLLYQMETLGERSRWELNWKLDYYLPGYRELATSRHKPAVQQAPRSITRKSHKADVFERLSSPRKRIPSPCHAMVCDAFKLGIANKTHKRVPDLHTPLSLRKKCQEESRS